MDLKKRVNLCILLGLGIVAGICGIVKMTYLSRLSQHEDITWETYDLILWAGSELFVLVFCGCVPPLKPLWDRHIRKKNPAPSGYEAYGSSSDRSNPFHSGNHTAYAKSDAPFGIGPSPRESPVVIKEPAFIRTRTDIKIVHSPIANMV